MENNVGTGSTVKWPIGLGGKGNDGIAAFVQRLPGAIGYVEYAYAKQNNLAYTKLISAMVNRLVRPKKTSLMQQKVQTGAKPSLRI